MPIKDDLYGLAECLSWVAQTIDEGGWYGPSYEGLLPEDVVHWLTDAADTLRHLALAAKAKPSDGCEPTEGEEK